MEILEKWINMTVLHFEAGRDGRPISYLPNGKVVLPARNSLIQVGEWWEGRIIEKDRFAIFEPEHKYIEFSQVWIEPTTGIEISNGKLIAVITEVDKITENHRVIRKEIKPEQITDIFSFYEGAFEIRFISGNEEFRAVINYGQVFSLDDSYYAVKDKARGIIEEMKAFDIEERGTLVKTADTYEEAWKYLKENGAVRLVKGEVMIFYRDGRYYVFNGDDEDFFEVFKGNFEAALEHGEMRELTEKQTDELIKMAVGIQKIGEGMHQTIAGIIGKMEERGI